MRTPPTPAAGGSRLVAVLGPTNTGKTHLAMERMLGHTTGMIGFPLRLLARENYDRAVKAKGAGQVALITGEERIEPPGARYYLCTVEAMPLARQVAFLAIDEIQMCADPDRGHVFTERLLHARGSEETMVMGAETIRPLIRRLAPEAGFIARPRFSALVHAGQAKLSRLPPRTAVVAFSVADVYALAELIRRQRGGTAIVLGALSPRTRNAQVAMYQAGEVDYLVATDAIGMGLNMQVDHVAFAQTRKFDGRAPRRLTPAELAQIAGRAGRFTRNGTFGTTADIGALDPEIAERIESHRFDPLDRLFWRSTTLNFTSLQTLRGSLARLPDRPGLVRAREADDERVLAHLAADPEIVRLAARPDTVRLLWDVCQIPDFGKVASEAHARLLGQIFRFLATGDEGRGRLPTDWVARQVDRLNRTDGDIEALMVRIAAIRTWTYVSHRPDWLAAAGDWQERTRRIEDKLSDALHDRLIQRFVDRRTASLLGRVRARERLTTAVARSGEVLVEGHPVGTLEGFRFRPAPGVDGSGPTEAGRIITAAAEHALRQAMAARVDCFEADTDAAFTLAGDGSILWHGALVARLAMGPDVLRPRVEPLTGDLLATGLRERVRRRLAAWLASHLAQHLAPLFAGTEGLGGPARGVLYQVGEGLGSLPRAAVAAQLDAVDAGDRGRLAARGLRTGHLAVWFPATLKPRAVALRAVLWSVHRGQPPAPPPAADRVSVAADPASVPGFLAACGYTVVAGLAIRVDMLERVARTAAQLALAGPFAPPAALATMLGCSRDRMLAVLADLGYRPAEGTGGLVAGTAGRRRRPRRRPPGAAAVDPDSPFAALAARKPAP
jgi:ATP-dependent RNA helicase SUPV3L1/SUV3